jgi:hypothetical protein
MRAPPRSRDVRSLRRCVPQSPTRTSPGQQDEVLTTRPSATRRRLDCPRGDVPRWISTRGRSSPEGTRLARAERDVGHFRETIEALRSITARRREGRARCSVRRDLLRARAGDHERLTRMAEARDQDLRREASARGAISDHLPKSACGSKPSRRPKGSRGPSDGVSQRAVLAFRAARALVAAVSDRARRRAAASPSDPSRQDHASVALPAICRRLATG